MRRLFAAPVLLVSLLASSAFAQETDWPEADPADVASIDAIVETIYAVISGPADEERDWDRFRSLHHPEARLIPTGPTRDGGWNVGVRTVDGYVEVARNAFRTTPLFQGKGFYETEAARRVERYDHIAQVWSTYESRLDPSEAPFQRGINTFQLVHDGERWWILNLLWQGETADAPLPAPYLPEGE